MQAKTLPAVLDTCAMRFPLFLFEGTTIATRAGHYAVAARVEARVGW
jgi:hypothetical protein